MANGLRAQKVSNLVYALEFLPVVFPTHHDKDVSSICTSVNTRCEIDKKTLRVGKRAIFRGLGCLRILSAQRVPVTVDRCLRLAELEPGSGQRGLATL